MNLKENRIAEYNPNFNSRVFDCSPFLCRAHRLGPSDDETYQRTSVSIMKREANNGILIHSYSPMGFNIDGNRVFGPCVVIPPAILQWNVRSQSKQSLRVFLCFLTGECVLSWKKCVFLQIGSSEDITEESISLFHMLEPPIGTT